MVLLTAPELSHLPHGFTTREAGTLALRSGEDVGAAWKRVGGALGMDPSQVVLVDQVHGDTVLEATVPTGPFATLGPADALITATPGLLLAVRVADCVPVLLAGPGGVGAVHAGWRGVAASIVPKAVRALSDRLGCAPSALVAVIGPHIGVGAFEVGEEVVEGIAATVPEGVFTRRSPPARPHVDLAAAVSWQLARAGVVTVGRVDRCTMQDPALWSHRRDGARAGRQAAVIAVGSP